MATYWLKIAKFSYPVLFNTPVPYVPLDVCGESDDINQEEASHGAIFQ